MSAIRPLLNNLIRRSYHAKEVKHVSMNDMPIPQGSWKANHDRKQAKYNLHLAGGILFTIATLVTAKASGLVYLNYSPPSAPADN